MEALIVANWKMNPATGKEAAKLFAATKDAVQTAKRVQVVVAPPAIFLREVAGGYRGTRISFAGQDAHFEQGGAHTGDTSFAQLKDAGASWVILGHAERRAEGQTNTAVGQRVASALAARFTPVLCVGERERHPNGDHFTFVREQLAAAFADVPAAKVSKVVIAYEPVWAIGAPQAMEARQMHEMAIFIRKTLADMYGKPSAGPILYGGAIDAQNAGSMLRDGDVAGLLVGRVSIDAESFKELVRAVSLA
jgi:triosephosphate isomerase